MFGGRTKVPLVVRTLIGAGFRAAAQHSQSLHASHDRDPGLKTVVPSNPRDAKGLLLAAIADDDPVVFCEPKRSTTSRRRPGGAVHDPARQGGDRASRIRAHDRRLGKAGHRRARAAATLAADGVDAEVVDLRTLSPLDEETVLGSLAKTGYLVVADEAPPPLRHTRRTSPRSRSIAASICCAGR
jgi:pyruvate dehydrogenase E1 component beta subunit